MPCGMNISWINSKPYVMNQLGTQRSISPMELGKKVLGLVEPAVLEGHEFIVYCQEFSHQGNLPY